VLLVLVAGINALSGWRGAPDEEDSMAKIETADLNLYYGSYHALKA
jgi:hypothetical protein